MTYAAKSSTTNQLVFSFAAVDVLQGMKVLFPFQYGKAGLYLRFPGNLYLQEVIIGGGVISYQRD